MNMMWINKSDVGPRDPYCRAEMYAGRVACWPLVSRGEYAHGTDGRQTVTLRFPLDAASVINSVKFTKIERISTSTWVNKCLLQ